jgi:periplasmic divalent cation tolerance protein
MQTIFVYCTCASIEQAQLIGKKGVEERLAACANILPGMQSIYKWNNELVQEEEVVLIFKTTQERFDALKSRVLELHSYEVPCVIALPISHGHEAYLNWIISEVETQ